MLTHAKSPIVSKARWVMLAAIASSGMLTLWGQPQIFWSDATKAIRGDGLSIHATTNPVFDFFLGHGALPFIETNLLYMTVAFFAVSRLPRMIALIAIFSAVFAHGYSATNLILAYDGLSSDKKID